MITPGMIYPTAKVLPEIMAKKQQTAEIPNGEKNSKNQNLPSTKNSLKFKIKINSKSKEITNGDASAEDAQAHIVPLSSTAPRNDSVGKSSKGKQQNGVNKRIPGDEHDVEVEKDNKKRKKKGGLEHVKNNKRKNKSKKEEVVVEEEETETEGKSESALGYIPMNQFSHIVRRENADLMISQEAIFLINRATEKFLQLFCKEAYDCAFRDRKKSVSYNHLSSVVSEQERFEFLSDFVPEKVKAEDALAQMETDK